MNLLIVGITGAMGRTVESMAQGEFTVYGVGQGGGEDVFASLKDVEPIPHVIIDFSHPSLTGEVVEFARKHKIPLVEATTGISPEDEEKIVQGGKEIPILYSHNMSIGVQVMDTILGQMVDVLQGFDIELIEKHHRLKKDAPSGTAKIFLRTIKERRNVEEVYDRTGKHGPRGQDEVGISVFRGGTVVGEHSVVFAGEDEILEIKHTALSKKIFAQGAIKGARTIMGKAPGVYTMKDVLKEDQ